jgi:protein involved in polysaccharide export with SLBB domain
MMTRLNGQWAVQRLTAVLAFVLVLHPLVAVSVWAALPGNPNQSGNNSGNAPTLSAPLRPSVANPSSSSSASSIGTPSAPYMSSPTNPGTNGTGPMVSPSGASSGIQPASATGSAASGNTKPSNGSSTAQPLPIDQSIVASRDSLPVFGQNLFQGNFSLLRAPTFNTDYVLTIGDQITVKMWGGYAFEGVLTVDSRGYIFLPEAGPVRVMGLRNGELNARLTQHIQRVFKTSVHLYASLETAQPVQVFVSGYVNKPGLFDGYSSSSILYYLDQAGGVNLNSGSFQDVRLVRGGQTVRTFNLYDFLLNGNLPPHQLRSGDVIHVGPVQNYVAVEGDVQNPARFEFKGPVLSGSAVLRYASPLPSASYVRLYRSNQPEKFSSYMPVDEFASLQIEPGDRVAFFTDKNPKTMTVLVKGEVFGQDSVVLPYGATLADLRPLLQATPKSDMPSLQIYRYSLALREKELIQQLLEKFQRQLFSRTSPSVAMAQVRNQDFALLNNFIALAAQAQPPGLIALGTNVPDQDVVLQDGDVVRIPPNENLVKIQGEVIQTTAQTYEAGKSIKDYVAKSAGFTGNADKRRIYVIHNNGMLEQVDMKYQPRPNDEIIIPTKVSGYNWIIAQDVVSTLYQLAIAARVFVIN